MRSDARWRSLASFNAQPQAKFRILKSFFRRSHDREAGARRVALQRVQATSASATVQRLEIASDTSDTKASSRAMPNLPDRPRLRPLQLFADETAGIIIIHDPQDFIADFGLDLRLAPLLLACDGRATLDELPRRLTQQSQRPWSPEEVTAIVERMDEWLLLDSPRFAALAAQRNAEFQAAPIRPAAHAGSSYPAEPDALRRRLDEILGQAERLDLAAEQIAGLVGVVAPHIDLRVGERAYAPAYRLIESFAAALPSQAPVTFVILGTSHYGGDGWFIASRKAYATPLGELDCDLDFLDRLEARLGYSISADDTAHRREHSIEFQAVFLRHIFNDPARPARIAPILCTSLSALYAADDCARQRARADYEAFIQALRETLAESAQRVALLVGGDLAHVGPKFGDAFDAQAKAGELKRADAELLEHVAAGDSQALLAHIARDEDARRVCGFPPLMAYLDALPAFGPTEGRALHYEQWQERPTRSAVTYGVAATWRKLGKGSTGGSVVGGTGLEPVTPRV